MQAPTSTSKPRALCPAGETLVRVVQVVDLGTQHFQQGDDGSRKLYFGFETPLLTHTFKDENGPEPFMLQTEFAWYMVSKKGKTKLRQFVEQFFGKAFPTDEAAQTFDFEKMLGKVVYATVVHQFKANGDPKAVIVGVRPAANVDAPKTHNPLVCYEVAHGENASFKKLPPFLQKKIKESDEFNPRHVQGPDDRGPDAVDPLDADDDFLS